MHDIKSKAVDLLSEKTPRQTAIFEVNQLLEKHFGNAFSADFDNKDRQKAFFCDLEKRISGYPLQYILGEWEFYSLPFYVGEGVLIPRPDTEILVDTVIEIYQKNFAGKRVNIIDLCSGSGCIAVALDKNLKNTNITALEKEPAAFEYLKRNIALNSSSVKPVKGDVFTDSANYTYIDIIVSNPPYIPSNDVGGLMPEVKHEPATALDGGKDGLTFYREICSKWKNCLADGGVLAVEIGADQKEDVFEIFCQNRFSEIECIKDLSGNDRVIFGFKRL